MMPKINCPPNWYKLGIDLDIILLEQVAMHGMCTKAFDVVRSKYYAAKEASGINLIKYRNIYSNESISSSSSSSSTATTTTTTTTSSSSSSSAPVVAKDDDVVMVDAKGAEVPLAAPVPSAPTAASTAASTAAPSKPGPTKKRPGRKAQTKGEMDNNMLKLRFRYVAEFIGKYRPPIVFFGNGGMGAKGENSASARMKKRSASSGFGSLSSGISSKKSKNGTSTKSIKIDPAEIFENLLYPQPKKKTTIDLLANVDGDPSASDSSSTSSSTSSSSSTETDATETVVVVTGPVLEDLPPTKAELPVWTQKSAIEIAKKYKQKFWDSEKGFECNTKGLGGKDVIQVTALGKLLRGTFKKKIGAHGQIPKGWTVTTKLREAGATKGTYDRYYMSPDGRKRCRSYAEIQR